MDVRKFPEEINNHKEEWVALTFDDKLAGHGKTPEICIQDAQRNGHLKEKITLLWVPDIWPGVRI